MALHCGSQPGDRPFTAAARQWPGCARRNRRHSCGAARVGRSGPARDVAGFRARRDSGSGRSRVAGHTPCGGESAFRGGDEAGADCEGYRCAAFHGEEPVAPGAGKPARDAGVAIFGRAERMNEHESIRAMLALAAAGALDPAESTRVERHANVCDDCRRELETWSRYAYGLRELPQPSAPPDLMERTRTRLLQERAVAEGRRWNGLMLGVLVVFGWATGLTLWILVRVFTGAVLTVFGANLVSGLTWSLVSVVLSWMTAAAAALMLGKSRQMRRAL